MAVVASERLATNKLSTFRQFLSLRFSLLFRNIFIGFAPTSRAAQCSLKLMFGFRPRKLLRIFFQWVTSMGKKKKPPLIPVTAMQGTMFPVVTQLPEHIHAGIGKVAYSHAFLEIRVQELVYDLMIMADYPPGRVVFEYRSAQVMFKTASELMAMWGIKPSSTFAKLEDEIKARAKERDVLVHSVWGQITPDEIGIRIAVDAVITPAGRHDRRYLPITYRVPDEYYEFVRQNTIQVALKVKALQDEIRPALQALRQKYSALYPKPDRT